MAFRESKRAGDPQCVADDLRAQLSPAGDYESLMQLVGKSRFALLGEASHGTHEFYRERIRITKRLIEERDFCAVAVEAD